MSKKKQRQFARLVAREIIRELARTPVPAPDREAVKTQADDNLTAARQHVRVSAAIAGFDDATADVMLAAGHTPYTAAVAFAVALQQEQ